MFCQRFIYGGHAPDRLLTFTWNWEVTKPFLTFTWNREVTKPFSTFTWNREQGFLHSLLELGARKCRSNPALLPSLLGSDAQFSRFSIGVIRRERFVLQNIHSPVYFFLGGLLPPNPCWAVTVRSITSFSAGIATPVTITGSPPRMEVLAVGKTNGR